MNAYKHASLPEQIRGYRIIEALGQGSMGEVFRAEVVEGRRGLRLGEHVALKVLGKRFSLDASIVRRFKREAGLGLSLRHPGVAAVYQVGNFVDHSDERRHFIAQELLDGRSLAEHLAEHGPLDEELLRSIALQIAGTLDFVHGRRIVHRDLKPANLFLDDAGRVKIVDFGLARLLRPSTISPPMGGAMAFDAEVTDSSIGGVPDFSPGPVDGRTTSTHFVGTVAYASPEQLRGTPATPASDVFALGLVLYELGCGRHPYAKEMRKGYEAYHDAVTSFEAARLTVRRPQLSYFFASVVEQMLKLDPSERLQDAAEVERVFAEGESAKWWIGATSESSDLISQSRRRLIVRRRTRVVHRDVEENILKSVTETLLDKAQGTALWIEGEAGIGKTRLIDLLALDVEDRRRDSYLLVTRGAAVAVPLPLYPLRLLLRDCLGLKGLSREDALQRARTQLSRYVPQRRSRDELLNHLLVTDEHRILSPGRVAKSYVAAFRGIAAETPTFLVVEGVHNVDSATLDVLLELCENVQEHALVLIVTVRPEELTQDSEAAGLERLRNQARILAPPSLPPNQLQALLADLGIHLGKAQSAAARNLHRLSGGNPYQALEIVENLRRRGHVARLLKSATTVDLPATLEELFASQFRRTSAGAKGVLEVVAILGGHVRLALLRSVAEVPARELAASLSELEREHLLVTEEGRKLRFRHGAFRSWLLARVTPPRRREVHAEAATFYQMEARAGAAPRASLKAALHAEAGGARDVLNQELDSAVRLLRSQGSLREAFRLARSAAVQSSRAPAQIVMRAAAQQLRGEIAHQLGEQEEERRAFGEVVRLAGRLKKPLLRAKALRGLGRLSSRTGEFLAAESLLRASLQALDDVGDAQALSRSLVELDLAETVLWSGDEQRAARLLDAVRIPQSDAAGRARLAMERGNLLLEFERFDEARAELRQGRALATRLGNRVLRRGLWLATARMFRELADHPQAMRAARAVQRSARSDGALRHLAIASYLLGDVAARDGQGELAHRSMVESLRLARRVGEQGLHAVVRGALSELYRSPSFSRRSLDRSIRHARRSIALARGVDVKRLEVRAQTALARCYLERGRPRWALSISRKAVSEASAAGVSRRRAAEVHLAHGQVLRRLGHEEEAKRSLGIARKWIERRLRQLATPQDRERVAQSDPLVAEILELSPGSPLAE